MTGRISTTLSYTDEARAAADAGVHFWYKDAGQPKSCVNCRVEASKSITSGCYASDVPLVHGRLYYTGRGAFGAWVYEETFGEPARTTNAVCCRCGAQADVPCHTPSGKPLARVHIKRTGA